MAASNPYISSPSASLALCLTAPIAVYAGSRRHLIIPAVEVDTKFDSSSEPAESEAILPTNRNRWIKRLKFMAFMFAILGVGGGLGVGLPLLATSNILDMFWLLFTTLQIGMIFRSAINTALPDPRILDVKWTAWNSVTWTVNGPTPNSPAPNTWRRLLSAGLLTMCSIRGVYSGSDWVICLPISALVYDSIGSIMVPNQPVRKMIKWIMYIQVALISIAGTMVGCFALYKLHKSSVSEADNGVKQTNFAQPSPEVLALMTMVQRAIPLIVSGFFVGMALRFDHCQANKTGDLGTTDIKPTSHSVPIPSFPKPMFKSAFKAFILQQVILALIYLMPIRTDLKEVLTIGEASCLTVWPVIWALISRSQRTGAYQDLMEYSETSAKIALSEQMATEEEDMKIDEEKAEQPAEPSVCVLTVFPDLNSSTSR